MREATRFYAEPAGFPFSNYGRIKALIQSPKVAFLIRKLTISKIPLYPKNQWVQWAHWAHII